MRIKNSERRVRFPAPREHDREIPAVPVLDEDEDAPCGVYAAMGPEEELPALQEYLRESGSWTLH